jgi:hypothetical protein
MRRVSLRHDFGGESCPCLSRRRGRRQRLRPLPTRPTVTRGIPRIGTANVIEPLLDDRAA